LPLTPPHPVVPPSDPLFFHAPPSGPIVTLKSNATFLVWTRAEAGAGGCVFCAQIRWPLLALLIRFVSHNCHCVFHQSPGISSHFGFCPNLFSMLLFRVSVPILILFSFSSLLTCVLFNTSPFYPPPPIFGFGGGLPFFSFFFSSPPSLEYTWECLFLRVPQ